MPANPGKPDKQLEWLGDRSALLSELQDELAKSDRTGDVDDVVKKMIADLENVAEILEGEGWDRSGDIAEALRHTLANWPPKMEYDL